MHCTSYLAFHVMFCIMLLAHCTVIDYCPVVVFLLWVELGDEFMNEEPVEYVHEEQVTDSTEDISGKMIITPRYHFYFAS